MKKNLILFFITALLIIPNNLFTKCPICNHTCDENCEYINGYCKHECQYPVDPLDKWDPWG